MAPTDQQIRNLAQLKAGRVPSWQSFGPAYYATRPPEVAADLHTLALPSGNGYATRAYLDIVLRRNPGYRTAVVTMPVYDATTDYTITIDGEPHTQNGTTDAATTLGLLRDDVNLGITYTGSRTIKGRSSHQIATYDAATTYNMVVDGRTHSAVAAGSIAATVTALVASINARHGTKLTATPNVAELPGVTAGNAVIIENDTGESYTLDSSVSGGTGTDVTRDHPASASLSSTTLTINGTGRADYTIAISEATGTGYLALDADATSVSVDVWAIGRNRTLPSKPDGATAVTHTENATIPVDCGGLTHLQARITSTDGRVSWAIGVSDLEG